MLTHYNVVNDGRWIGNNMEFTHNDRLCIPVPLFHCFGCVLALWRPSRTARRSF
jgi:fatty-acyl-CoA synthase